MRTNNKITERVIRMHDDTFVNMISESVLRSLNEGFWKELGSAGKSIGKYAVDRILAGGNAKKDIDSDYDTDKDKMGNIRKHYEKNSSMSKEEFDKYDKGTHKKEDNSSTEAAS